MLATELPTPTALQYAAPTQLDFRDWLELIPALDLRADLLDRADEAIAGIRADLARLHDAWSTLTVFLERHRRLPALEEIAGIVAVDRPRLALLIERLELEVRHVAGYRIRLAPVTDLVHHDDEERERGRRADIYAAQWAEIETRYEVEDNPFRRGPAAQAVQCVESGQVFPSARTAAAWLGCKRSDIRTSIKRKTECCGFTWRYAGERRIRPSGREFPIRCIEFDGMACDETFASLAEAGRWAGGSPSTVLRSIEDASAVRMGGMLMRFERVTAAEPAASEVTATNLHDAAMRYLDLAYSAQQPEADELATHWPFLAAVAAGELSADVVAHFYPAARVLARVVKLPPPLQYMLMAEPIVVAERAGGSFDFHQVDARDMTHDQVRLVFFRDRDGRMVLRTAQQQARVLEAAARPRRSIAA